jgi:hypothetical protein
MNRSLVAQETHHLAENVSGSAQLATTRSISGEILRLRSLWTGSVGPLGDADAEQVRSGLRQHLRTDDGLGAGERKRGMVQFAVPSESPISMIGIRVGTIGATTTIPILTK